MNISKILFALPLLATLSGCASAVSGATQRVTIVTPGSTSSRCILENGVRYKADSGVPIEIMRSEKDLVVDCYGTDNRNRKIIVESKVNGWTAGNVALGGVPVVYDHFSKGMYEYPDVITVDFVGLGAHGYELPQYHDKDMPNPYDTAIEPYTPSTPRLPQDSGYLKRGLEKRSHVMDSNPFMDRAASGSGTGFVGPDGDSVTPMPMSSSSGSMGGSAQPASAPVLKGSTAEELTRSMNPTVFNQ